MPPVTPRTDLCLFEPRNRPVAHAAATSREDGRTWQLTQGRLCASRPLSESCGPKARDGSQGREDILCNDSRGEECNLQESKTGQRDVLGPRGVDISLKAIVENASVVTRVSISLYRTKRRHTATKHVSYGFLFFPPPLPAFLSGNDFFFFSLFLRDRAGLLPM